MLCRKFQRHSKRRRRDSFRVARQNNDSLLMSLFKHLSLVLLFLLTANARAQSELDIMGGALLRQVAPGVLGTGVQIGQAEGYEGGVTGAFEVSPSVVGQPTNLFTWISASGTASTFPNAVGSVSGHADQVAFKFYGANTGVAPQVAHVNNYDADYFYDHYITLGLPLPNSDRVVNQSFIFANTDGSHFPTNQEQDIESAYDDFSIQYGTLFVSGAGNGGLVYPPATSYNGIGVGVYPGSSSFGTTPNGRSKPDIVGPGGVTSFSTPYVAGSAAALIQAALSGDGGTDTNSASDNRTIKAVLLNGAVKMADWTNGVTTPLDARYGAGMLNEFNSWNELRGGKHPFVESTSVSVGNAHPPGGNAGNEPVLTGWDLNSLANPDLSHDQINHYYFNLPGGDSFTLTATLTWLRPHSSLLVASSINDLNLYLYNVTSGQMILSSTSAVDNVEHLYLPALPPGRYDLQVEKNAQSQVSAGETYGLAFEFFSVPLSIAESNGDVMITWPLAPAGFELQSTTNLNAPGTWAAVPAPVTVDTKAGQNAVVVPETAGNQFFRLRRP
jgi:hypothetical protein